MSQMVCISAVPTATVLRNVTSLTGLDRLPVGIEEPRIAGVMRPLVA